MVLIKRVLLTVLLAALVLVVGLGWWLYHPDLPLDYLKDKYAGPDSRFMALDGMQVHYRDQGQGPVVVLVHGTASSLHTWEEWTQGLKKRYRVVRMDLPAFGLTGPNRDYDYSLEAYDAFLVSFLDKLGIERCHLAGNSLGGAVAWNFASHHPQRVDKLILVDAAGLPRRTPMPRVFRLARLPVLGDLLPYIGSRALVEKNVREVYGDKSRVTPALVDRYYELSLRPGNREAFLDRARLDLANQSFRLAAVEAPTLVLWGEDDAWIPLADGREMARRIPGAKLITYPGVGHVPMEEIAQKTLVDVEAFLQGG